jgi:hypothetical protein
VTLTPNAYRGFRSVPDPGQRVGGGTAAGQLGGGSSSGAGSAMGVGAGRCGRACTRSAAWWRARAGLAATDDRLYAVAPLDDAVWALDRWGGALVQTIATGRGPIGLVLADG